VKRFLVLFTALCALLLLFFGILVALGAPVDADPLPRLREHEAWAGALVAALLVADVLLPVPSSLLMIASGALCGPWLGALWSSAGALGAAAFAWWLGRRGGALYERLLGERDALRTRAWLERHGWLAIAASRPVPILAEATALAAGAAGLPFARVLASAALGALPICVFYALVGSGVLAIDSPWLAFAIALFAAAPLWWIGARWSRATTSSRASSRPTSS
jgi:uncharacterized membrane protein YdjX (TVP38/TMEM64 family)